jgi:uncharacterized SAM-binding protein YcdF (DUF218 family)
MFFFKKTIAPLFYPLSIIMGLLVIGLFLMWFTRKQKTGKFFITAGVAVLVLFSYGAISDCILQPLEKRFPPVMIESQLNIPIDISSAKWIVVLGGGHKFDRELPVTSEISEESLVRLIEAIRIYKTLPGKRIILSGGSVFSLYPEAKALSKIAQMLGVPSQDITLDNTSRDTEEQAMRIRSIVGDDTIILVTSAYHMPRSVALFKKLAMNPIPAPTNHMVFKKKSIAPDDFYPSVMGLRKAERAIHEYLGLVWSKMRNKI